MKEEIIITSLSKGIVKVPEKPIEVALPKITPRFSFTITNNTDKPIEINTNYPGDLTHLGDTYELEFLDQRTVRINPKRKL